MFKELKRLVYQVADVAEARRWYVQVLGAEPLFDSPLACIFAVGQGSLSLARGPSDLAPGESRCTGYWEVDDVDQAFARLVELGALAKASPSDVLNIRTAQVQDPFGNIVGLTGPIPKDRQRSIEEQPSQTAYHICMCRALVSRDDRAVICRPDPFAELFLEPEHRAALSDGAKRTAMIDRRVSRPLYGFLSARSAFIDEVFLRALRAGTPQIVLLGAGYDTRALRFQAELRSTRIFEVDAPPTQRRKIEFLKASGTMVLDQVRYVSVNFKTDDLVERLKSEGFNQNVATLFIWEGVTYYLTQIAVDRTLKLLRGLSGAGSSIVFDYMTAKLESINSGEPFLSWMAPGDVPGWLQQHGFRLVEDLDADQMARRFLMLPDGTLTERPLSSIHLALAELEDSRTLQNGTTDGAGPSSEEAR